MTVVQGWAGGQTFQVTGEGYVPEGQFYAGDTPFTPTTIRPTSLLLRGGVAVQRCTPGAERRGGR